MRVRRNVREAKSSPPNFTFLFPVVNKSALRDAVLVQLRSDLAQQTRAAWLARDEATNEESRAENKYDTRGQEAAYLAEGQARLAAEIDESISQYAAMPLPIFSPGDSIALGAVVELTGRRGSAWYFLGPRAGGTEVKLGERTVMIVTPISPLGRQLIGKMLSDSVAMSGGSQRILAVE